MEKITYSYYLEGLSMKFILAGVDIPITLYHTVTVTSLQQHLPSGLDFIKEGALYVGRGRCKLDIAGVTMTSKLRKNALYYDDRLEALCFATKDMDASVKMTCLGVFNEEMADHVGDREEFYVFLDQE
jgi:hypothetical protein